MSENHVSQYRPNLSEGHAGIALITGASRGLGAAIAADLAAAGHHVVAVGRSLESLEAVCGSIEDAGGRADARAVDVADVAAVEAMVRDVVRDLGPISTAVVNAGVNPVVRPAIEVSPAEFDAVFDVNVRGAYFTCTSVLSRMAEVGTGGAIVVIGSIGAVVPVPNNAPYCMSKAAAVQLVGVLALEAAPHGVRVNAVNPGFVETDLTAGLLADGARRASLTEAIPLARIGETDDVVGAVRYLVSDESRYVTGAVLPVDGGYSLQRSWPIAGRRRQL